MTCMDLRVMSRIVFFFSRLSLKSDTIIASILSLRYIFFFFALIGQHLQTFSLRKATEAAL